MRRPSPSRFAAPRRHWLTRVVALVAIMGQLLVAAAAWADAAAEGVGDARPHVEVQGTRLHHAHVESDCALCAAQHLDPATLRQRGPALAGTAAPMAAAGRCEARPRAVARGRKLSRAPPSTHA